MIIGVSGKKRVGKNTVGMYLELKYGYKPVAFADELKNAAKTLGWDGRKDDKGRVLLQHLGCLVRAYDPNFWIKKAEVRIADLIAHGQADFVVTDVRFPNEVEWVKSQGGVVIRVWSKTEISDDAHESETALDDYPFDFKVESIRNDFNHLYQQVDAIVEAL